MRSMFSASLVLHMPPHWGSRFFHSLMEEVSGSDTSRLHPKQSYRNHSPTHKLVTPPLFQTGLVWSRKLTKTCEASGLSNSSPSAPINSLKTWVQGKAWDRGSRFKGKILCNSSQWNCLFPFILWHGCLSKQCCTEMWKSSEGRKIRPKWTQWLSSSISHVWHWTIGTNTQKRKYFVLCLKPWFQVRWSAQWLWISFVMGH